MDFVKYQALGNDYLVLDPHRVDFQPTPHAVRALCDRHFGVGADGILLGPLSPVGGDGPVRLRIFNSDGSECEKSGNGLRIFALYLAENYPAGDRFVIQTSAGDAGVWIRDFDLGLVQVDMGIPRIEEVSTNLAVDGQQLSVTLVDVGNPHVVIPVPHVSKELAFRLGPAIAHHERFPAGANVEFVRVVNRDTIQIEIWERGAGYTLASGSSSCAAAAGVTALGLVDQSVDVRMPGGSIEIDRRPDGHITMTGLAEQVSDGRFAPRLRDRLRSSV